MFLVNGDQTTTPSPTSLYVNPCPAEPGDTLPLQIVETDHLVSQEANWSGSTLFAIQYMNLYQQCGSNNLTGWNLEVGGTL